MTWSWSVVWLPLLALGTLSCGGSEGDGSPNGNLPNPGVPDTGAGSDTGSERDSGATDGAAPMAVNGCTEGAFVETTDAKPTIFVGRDGLVFTPKCLTIAAGTTVRWEGSLAAHPVAPGNFEDAQAGSPGNPIQPTASGNSVEFTFTTPGTFAYYCELHSFGPGNGMAGVVFVR